MICWRPLALNPQSLKVSSMARLRHVLDDDDVLAPVGMNPQSLKVSTGARLRHALDDDDMVEPAGNEACLC